MGWPKGKQVASPVRFGWFASELASLQLTNGQLATAHLAALLDAAPFAKGLRDHLGLGDGGARRNAAG